MSLATGRVCLLSAPRVPLLRHYFVLTFQRDQGEPGESEIVEMFGIALQEGRRLGREKLGNEESFVIIYSGRANRRAAGWHIHIVLVNGRWHKAWLYFVLWGKNVLQAIGLRRDQRS